MEITYAAKYCLAIFHKLRFMLTKEPEGRRLLIIDYLRKIEK